MRSCGVEIEYRQLGPLTFKSNCAPGVQKMSVYPPKRACLLPGSCESLQYDSITLRTGPEGRTTYLYRIGKICNRPYLSPKSAGGSGSETTHDG